MAGWQPNVVTRGNPFFYFITLQYTRVMLRGWGLSETPSHSNEGDEDYGGDLLLILDSVQAAVLLLYWRTTAHLNVVQISIIVIFV